MFDWRFIKRKFPSSYEAVSDWMIGIASQRNWHQLLRVGRMDFRLMPMEWMLGPLIEFFRTSGILIEPAFTRDGEMFARVMVRSRAREVLFAKASSTHPYVLHEDAWDAALQLAFSEMEKLRTSSSAGTCS